jgi:hypothetical protein
MLIPPTAISKARKAFFFEKETKTLDFTGFGLSG